MGLLGMTQLGHNDLLPNFENEEVGRISIFRWGLLGMTQLGHNDLRTFPYGPILDEMFQTIIGPK